MAAWLTVYASAPVERLGEDFLVECIHDPILGDIGESWGFDHDAVRKFMRRLEVHPLRGARDESYSIIVPDQRPIEVTRLVEPARIAEERDEALETVDGLSRASRARVETLLGNLTEVVMFELGWPSLDREEFIVAWYAALELADGVGLVQDFEQKWWDPEVHWDPLE